MRFLKQSAQYFVINDSMCYFKKSILTPFNRLAVCGGQPLRMQVSCGKCSECREEQVKEWKFRTHYEALSAIRAHGFVYYITLTYSSKHLPKLSHFYDITETNITDFSCFNHEHFKLFLKRLRRRLEYHHRGTSFRYFLTSEYGTDERFTHRPHYHVLFFVYYPTIDPFDFSAMISDCWEYGRTDGLPYKDRDYVRENIFQTEEHKSIERVSRYISKYVQKDSKFQSELDRRLSMLEKKGIEQDTIKKLSRQISQYHRQSKGFGIYYLMTLTDEDKRNIFETSSIRIKDSKKVVNTQRLPLYYKRKLFYKTIKMPDKKIAWIPTDYGKEYLRHSYYRNISKSVDTLKSQIANLPAEEQIQVHKLLGNRSLSDLAIFNLYYKGYSRDLSNINCLFHGFTEINDTEYNLYDWIENILEAKFVNCKGTNHIKRDKDNNTISIPHTIFSDITKPYYENIDLLTFDSHTAPHFHNFDRIMAIIDYNQKQSNTEKEKVKDFLENLNKRIKALNTPSYELQDSNIKRTSK